MLFAMARWLKVLFGMWLLVGAAGCGLLEGGCGCGADPSDPLAEHDLSFAGTHVVDDQCVCRCGDDEPEAQPKIQACKDYEDVCEDRDGRERRSICH